MRPAAHVDLRPPFRVASFCDGSGWFRGDRAQLDGREVLVLADYVERWQAPTHGACGGGEQD